MAAVPDPRETIGPDDKVAFLSTPSAYPDATGSVESIETHMAWVFLTDRHAYKLKKPVAYDELDFTTLKRRRWACAEEVRLNRRLAGDVYEGVVSLRADPDGPLHLGGNGVVVDWLVQMQRLPADRMLDVLIEGGDASFEDIQVHVQAAFRKLTHFYRAARSIPFAPSAYVRHFRKQIGQTASRLNTSPYHIPRDMAQRVAAQQLAFLRRDAVLLESRAQHIVEGHGDLRPEHICLTDDPVIFDCIEFDRALRVLDPVDEIGFLGMECKHLGASALGTLALTTYADATGDVFPDRLVRFYQSHRAMERAQIAVRHTRRPRTADEAKWSRQATAYLELAAHYAERM
jgi:aminoglycoside phosphotransferase family enzyme